MSSVYEITWVENGKRKIRTFGEDGLENLKLLERKGKIQIETCVEIPLHARPW